MLHEVLVLFEQAERALCIDEVAVRIGKPPSAVEGMLDLLVRKGKLIEQQRLQNCDSCPIQDLCHPSIASHRFFTLAPRKTHVKALN